MRLRSEGHQNRMKQLLALHQKFLARQMARQNNFIDGLKKSGTQRDMEFERRIDDCAGNVVEASRPYTTPRLRASARKFHCVLPGHAEEDALKLSQSYAEVFALRAGLLVDDTNRLGDAGGALLAFDLDRHLV